MQKKKVYSFLVLAKRERQHYCLNYFRTINTTTCLNERLRRNPSLLRQELATAQSGDIVIIDEIQLIPELLNEVHWLITRQNIHFILSCSSARKLKR